MGPDEGGGGGIKYCARNCHDRRRRRRWGFGIINANTGPSFQYIWTLSSNWNRRFIHFPSLKCVKCPAISMFHNITIYCDCARYSLDCQYVYTSIATYCNWNNIPIGYMSPNGYNQVCVSNH